MQDGDRDRPLSAQPDRLRPRRLQGGPPSHRIPRIHPRRSGPGHGRGGSPGGRRGPRDRHGPVGRTDPGDLLPGAGSRSRDRLLHRQRIARQARSPVCSKACGSEAGPVDLGHPHRALRHRRRRGTRRRPGQSARPDGRNRHGDREDDGRAGVVQGGDGARHPGGIRRHRPDRHRHHGPWSAPRRRQGRLRLRRDGAGRARGRPGGADHRRGPGLPGSSRQHIHAASSPGHLSHTF